MSRTQKRILFYAIALVGLLLIGRGVIIDGSWAVHLLYVLAGLVLAGASFAGLESIPRVRRRRRSQFG